MAEVSVIICTYNRSGNLPDCIESLAGQQGVEGLGWEVLLVDNNSTDDTRRVFEALEARYPTLVLRYAFEPEQGLSAARNCGIRETRGDFYLFIDDDIRVTPGWLSAMHGALKDNDADAVGGRIHIDPRYVIPVWIRPDMYGFLGHQDFGETPLELDGKKQFPFGGNMGFHRRVADRIGLFDTGYGRKGEGKRREELLKGEETEYFRRLSDAGGRIVYAPGGLVYHSIKPFQLRKRYFRTIHFNQGYLTGYLDRREHARRLLGIPLFVFSQALRALRKYAYQVLRKGANAAFRQQMNVVYFIGLMRGYAKGRSR
jgi:glycosyltransferase involved in cell wall biosynthesis